jgi:hypothetical protein
MKQALGFQLTILVSTLALGCDRSVPVASEDLSVQFGIRNGFQSAWSEAVNLGPPINTAFVDQSPALSPDGLSLYFASDRPGGLGGTDLWVSRRASKHSPWDVPVNLGSPINTSGIESGPNLSRDSRMLFFQSNRAGGQGSNDMYVAYRTDPNNDLAWQAPVNLGPDVNSSIGEFGPWFQEHDSSGPMLYFTRGLVSSFTDIYAAPITRDGHPREPAHLIAVLSDPNFTDGRTAMPATGKAIVFPSNRTGTLGATDLWVATRHTVHGAWSQPVSLGAPPNTSYNDLLPFLTRSGRTLLFTSDRPGFGGFDIWMSTRVASEADDEEP